MVANKVNVFGTEYRIEIKNRKDDEYMVKNSLDGYCSTTEKLIVVSDMSDDMYTSEKGKQYHLKHVVRHELLHAVFGECGLSDCANCFDGSWVNNEEMIDFVAFQFPKILEIFRQAGCL